MATSEEAVRLEARIEQIKNTTMVQSGALSSAKELAEAQHLELTQVMKDLHDTVAHTVALQARIDAPPDVAAVEFIPPPGIEALDHVFRLGPVRILEREK